MQALYPILLDVTDKKVLIVGGGAVAVRKATGLVEAGGRKIIVVSPTFADGFPADVQKVGEAYRPEHLEGVVLVFAATDSPAVNAAVVRDARLRNVLVSRADGDAETPGDFVTPARLREGLFTVAVSSESPALSALVRDGLKARWDARWTPMAEATREFRRIVLASGLPISRRRDVFRDLATDAALDVLAAHGMDGLRAWVLERHPELMKKKSAG